ncbi:PadR family transcriptional regulator [Pelagibacterium luteolum]|uniref:DNA-binding transcriptional regulator, PadR family n=1 Tax=Pelagibacterium luteolum TaxID=440168 RepID=A0A1G7TTZ6_9HYPH|nr:PadR family transcriptional regulator [Pelagibacterium luteolum]SDG38484.1 DNA-binding transcriptional regulator, PadR family [Pelagibacterium luteolum]
MSATRLLVLAFVRAHGRAHGYLIGQELLTWNADKWANTKTGSIYHALRQLSKERLLIEFSVPAVEAAPARTEYEISDIGEAEFLTLLERALTQPDPRPDMFCAGLVLMSALPREQVLSYLRARVAILNQQRVNVDRANSEANFEGEKALPPHVDALLNFWVEHTASGLHWVEELVSKIEGGAYVFADDDPRAFGTPSSLATTAII